MTPYRDTLPKVVRVMAGFYGGCWGLLNSVRGGMLACWHVIKSPYWGDKSKDNTEQTLTTAYTRLRWGMFGIFVAFGLVALQLWYLTLLKNSPSFLNTAVVNPLDIPITSRASILDRNGVIMARSLPSDNLMAYPREIMNVYSAAYQIASVFPHKNTEKLVERLQRGKPFLVQRSLTPLEKYSVNALGIPGLEFEKTEVRMYPQERIASHILGGLDADQRGRMGVEYAFNKRLTRYDRAVELSIDTRVQTVVHEELSRVMTLYNAKSASGIVMNPNTGEIIGMVSLPDFDIDRIKIEEKNNMRNHAIQDVYEMGSTFKIVNTALALDRGGITLSDTFDVDTPLWIGRFPITDDHPEKGTKAMTPAEVFTRSSNKGTARMALQVGGEQQQQFLSDLGLLAPLPLELGPTAPPIIPKQWGRATTATVSFGHGLAVSPLGILNASNAIVNGGILHKPTLFPVRTDTEGKRVISEKTSETLRYMMRLNVVHGTGSKADVPGYMVGGKTGTADIWTAEKGYDSRELMVSFLGVYPVHDPRYTVLVTVERPKVKLGRPSGGRIAAPAVGHIIRRTAPLLQVAPVSAQQQKATTTTIAKIPHRPKPEKP